VNAEFTSLKVFFFLFVKCPFYTAANKEHLT